jgi:hypothetical protein
MAAYYTQPLPDLLCAAMSLVPLDYMNPIIVSVLIALVFAALFWLRAEDQRWAAHIRQFHEADWHAPAPFHLILNTELLDEQTCIRLVLNAAKQVARQPRSADQKEAV